MKPLLSFIVLGSATIASAAVHGHHHARFHHNVKRVVENVVVTDVEIKYVFEGKDVSLTDVCRGLNNGTFVWDARAGERPSCKAPGKAAADTNNAQRPSGGARLQQGSNSSPAVSTDSNIQSNINTNYLTLLQSNPGVDQDFPDGQLPCTFASLQKYGAVPLNYLGYSGYTAIVSASIVNGVVSELSGNLASGGDGNYFSYACPEGYMKAQWPQQNSGQTVGGVLCSGGVFHLTNPASSKLCTPGAGSMNAVNNAGKVISVCNTDYPATEDETVPTRVAPGSTAKLAITNSGTFFKHIGSMTSAQYYLNPAGFDIQEACQWGSNNGLGVGNWAPVNLGLGTDSAGSTVYVGLFSAEQVLHDPANPGKVVLLNYNVLVSGPSGQTCEYRNENGQGVFYSNGVSQGYMGQTFDGKSVPGVTCAYPQGSDMTVTFS